MGLKILMAQIRKLIREARITLGTFKEKDLHIVFITPSGRDVNQKNHGKQSQLITRCSKMPFLHTNTHANQVYLFLSNG